MKHTTILVTGATGTVGREVVKQLSMLDGNLVRVRAGVHSLIKGENLRRLPEVEVVEMNFEDPASLHAAFTHVDKVLLITPFTEDQVQMLKTLVDEAKKRGVQHIIRLSAMGADASPGITLGRQHREMEKYIEASGMAYTFLRPAGFMQNFLNYADSIRHQGKFYQPTGTGKVGYIDVRDIATVAVEVLTGSGHEGKVYELTGPEAISGEEVAQIFSNVLGKPVAFVDVPEEEARKAMLEHMPAWMVDALLELNSIYKAGYSSATTDTVEEVTDRMPHAFEQFARDYKECFE
ncbi:SDR family oxidoreductase [Pontibacter liquoris]|uniref:SDR family oxidoreductase n=1 Tax=Pontibacter liquoris TaxID=2905677 RepID=UPI001FA79B75|nr:SDR family oxidoreductase [Pontibacter liquoris]